MDVMNEQNEICGNNARCNMENGVLIVGQGLAGSTLAWELLERGVSVLVVDRPIGETASRVAAGLVNPMMGKSFRAGWRQAECMDYAATFYPETERVLGGRWWQRVPIWRELETDDQVEIWQERQLDPETSLWAGPMLPWPKGWEGKGLAGYTNRSYVLHAEAFTNAMRPWLAERGAFEEGEVRLEDVTVDEQGVLWRGRCFDCIVWAIGWEVCVRPDMEPLKGRPSMGTIIDVKLPDLEWSAGILHYGHWLVHHEDVWRLGATYAWTWSPDLSPDMMALQELYAGLARHYGGSIETVRHRSAIRPTVRRSQPVAGPIPDRPREWVFSGLGSKGVTTAPRVASILAESLCEGVPVPSDLDPAVLWAMKRR